MSAIAPVKRIASIDILRGIIMVIMALDHTRDYFTDYYYSPTDLQHASTFMFFTRWITHYCAPVFVFLSGASAYLSFQKGKSKKEAALFLLTRGIWLVLLELTIVRFGWEFNVNYDFLFVQVIWAIGWSMIFLAGLIFLPLPAILSIGLILICGHNLLDPIHADNFGENGLWWKVVHEQGSVTLGNSNVFIGYPLVPWIGVMATGYVFGTVLKKPNRDTWLYAIGSTAILLFIILRAGNIYGDPYPWQPQGSWHRTLLSMLNCQKYPPSLLYLLMTLGPAILSMPLLEKMNGRLLSRWFTVYGRVPMFYYILHIYLIHVLALLGGVAMGLNPEMFLSSPFGEKPGWGFSLPVVYAVWLLVVFILYFPSRWFMYVKMNNKKWWLSYL